MNSFGSTYGYESPLEKKMREEYEKSLELAHKKSDIEGFKKMIEDAAKSAHAALVQKSISESAADAAASAERASSQAAVYDALSKAAANKHAAMATEFSAQMDQILRETNRIKSGAVPGVSDVVESAAEGYEKSMTDENYNLPEVEVKSDFGKYLLIGGGVLLAIYLLRGKKKNA